jgi:membrane protein
MKAKQILFPFRVVVFAFKKFLHDDCISLSSSISFVFILSIIPFATLNTFIFRAIQKLVFSDNSFAEFLQHVLAKEMVKFIPLITEEWVNANIFQPHTARASFTVINLCLLPIVSGLVFKTMETAYRRIFSLPGRHLFFGQVLYAMVTVFIVLLFFITSFTWSIVSAPLLEIIRALAANSYFIPINTFLNTHPIILKINFVSIVTILLFYFATIKIFLPVFSIALRHILCSGIVFCTLWLLARIFFQVYVQHISRVNVVYGSLSSIVIILLWIFYSSIALLYSIEILYVLNIHKNGLH